MVHREGLTVPWFRGLTPQGRLEYGWYRTYAGKEYILPARYDNNIRVEIVPGSMDFFTGEWDMEGIPMYRGDEVTVLLPGGIYTWRAMIEWRFGGFYLHRPSADPLLNDVSYVPFSEWFMALSVVGNRHEEKNNAG